MRGKVAVPVGSVRFVGSYAMPAGRDADACRRRVWGWLRRPPTNNSWQAGERIGVQGRAGEGHGPRDVRAWCNREVVMAKQAANVRSWRVLGKAVQGGAGVAIPKVGTARARRPRAVRRRPICCGLFQPTFHLHRAEVDRSVDPQRARYYLTRSHLALSH